MLRRLARRLAEIERRAALRRRAREWGEKWRQMRAVSPGDGKSDVGALARQFTGEALGSLAALAVEAASEWVRFGAARELFARAGPV